MAKYKHLHRHNRSIGGLLATEWNLKECDEVRCIQLSTGYDLLGEGEKEGRRQAGRDGEREVWRERDRQIWKERLLLFLPSKYFLNMLILCCM